MTKYFLLCAFLCTPLFAEKATLKQEAKQQAAAKAAPEKAPKKALIFGITGQDGSYLAELLLDKGYEVHGVKRRSSSLNTQRLDHLYEDPHTHEKRRLILHYGDVATGSNVSELIRKIMPDEIYNLAAQSHVQVSFEDPEYTADIVALGPLRILEAIRSSALKSKTRFYQASSSEMFGLVQSRPQNEKTPFYPRSPYGVAKQFGHGITKNYRESYGIFACSGILFNHESPRRGETFVTRKITRAVAAIAAGKQKALYLGNLNASRDWGHAKDYVEAMWLMLQADKPNDFVISSDETHTVREFVELAFKEVNIPIKWRGEGLKEVGYNASTGKELVFIDPRYFRPAEVDFLLGDSTFARKTLGWKPRHSFQALVVDMVQSDLKELGAEPVKQALSLKQ